MKGHRRTETLRLGLFIGVLFSMLLVLAGGGWYIVREATSLGEGSSAPSGTIDISSLERALLGLYLSFRGAEIEQPAGESMESAPFTIQPGQTAATIASRLDRKGLIRDAGLFRLLVRYRGVDNQLQAGEYELSPGMNMDEIIRHLTQGRTKAIRLTVIEGWRTEEIAGLVAERRLGSRDEFMSLVRLGEYDYAFLQDRPPGDSSSLEGFLFPDTYLLSTDVSASDLIREMLDTFDERFTPATRQQTKRQGMTIYEVVTLASIVEREAAIPQERPIIASVFLNRLKKGMHLQADPTVQYALGFHEEQETWWRKLHEEDLEIDSPYNTYKFAGLPPGPICNPGLASLEAVLKPAETEYLYFVRNDLKGDGSHVFAKTFTEHLVNMQKYR